MKSQFAHIPTAEYQELGNVNSLIAQGVDWALGGRKGMVITEAIIAKKLARNPEQLRQFYKDNSKTLNDYFDKVDTHKIVDMMLTDQEKTQKAMIGAAVVLLSGVLIGTGIAFAIRRK